MEFPKITELCKLAYKYGTDKCPQIHHAYTPAYYELFMGRRLSVRKVLEFGIGRTRQNKYQPQNACELDIKPLLQRGASLYMWRDFFPNAQIFGADISPDTIFEDERIKTFLCDERKEDDVIKLVEAVGSDIDIVIDDASHRVADQVLLARTLLPLLQKDVIYIIEDVGHSRYIRRALSESGDYEYTVPAIDRPQRGGQIVVIRNKV